MRRTRWSRTTCTSPKGPGAAVYPETTAVMVRPLGNDGYAVDTVRTGAWRAGRTARTFTAEQVVFAAGRGHAAATAQDAGRLRCDRRVSEPQPLGACSQQRITGQDHPPVYPHRCDALCSHCRSASVHALASLEPSSFLRCRSGTRAWCRSGSPGAIFDHWTLSVLTCRLAWRRADTITGTGSAPAGAHRRRAEVRLRSRGLGPEQLLVASSRSCRTPASRSARATR